jgi:hypothetical protein
MRDGLVKRRLEELVDDVEEMRCLRTMDVVEVVADE